MKDFDKITELKFWCQKVLPLVYDDSLSYYELLCKVVKKLNELVNAVDGIPDYIKELISEETLKPILSEVLDELREQIAKANEHDSKTATANRTKGELVWLEDKLYRVTRDMLAGDQYFLGSNTEKVTIEEILAEHRVELDTLPHIVESVQVVSDNLEQEIQDRVEAFTVLEEDISTEAQARVTADNILQGAIDNEKTAREEAVENLQDAIDGITEKFDGDLEVNNMTVQGNLKYKTPITLNPYFKYMNILGADGNTYRALIEGERSVEELAKASIFINVKDYGAVGDGVADDTEILQECIDLCASNGGGIVYIPHGTYNTTATLYGKDKVSLLGESTDTTVIDYIGENSKVAILDIVNVDIRGGFFSNMTLKKHTSTPETTLDNNKLNVGIKGGCSYEKYNSAICSFDNIKIGNCAVGISGLGTEGESRAIGLFDCVFKNVFLYSCTWAGFCLSGSGNVIIEPRVTYSNTAFMFYHVSDESFDGCTVIGGVVVSSTGYDITFRMSGMRPVVFIGTWFEQSNYGICNIVAASSKVMNITFIGCMFNSNSTQYDMFTMSNVAYGIIEIFNCTFYSTIAGANTNVILPTTSTTVKGIVRDCIKISNTGAYSLYSVNA